MTTDHPAVALILPYWSFWEASAGGKAFRDDRETLLDTIKQQLAADGIEVTAAMIDSEESGGRFADEVREAGPHAIVVAQTMAVPPSYTMATLDAAHDVPVVVWALQTVDKVAPDFDEAGITSYGATVGTPMLTNVLGRRGRPFTIVFGPPERTVTEITKAISAAATAHGIRTSTLARVGRPLDGYECVDVDSALLSEALGIDVLELGPEELASRYQQRAGPVEEVRAELETAYESADDVEPETITRAVGLAAALADLDRNLGISMGALNCHVRELRYGDDPGITACFGVGRETSRGIPWTCVGDVLTAIAMFVGRRLGGAALYHEIEAADFETGEVAIANSGEHDMGWCPAATKPRLLPNRWFAHDERATPSVWFELPPGPATLIGFTPHASEPSGFRFIAAEGEITSRPLPSSPTVGGMFRFAKPLEEAWPAWARSGVNHHSSASPGHLGDAVRMVSDYLGVGCVLI